MPTEGFKWIDYVFHENTDIFTVDADAIVIPVNPGLPVGEGIDRAFDEKTGGEFAKMRDRLLKDPGTVDIWHMKGHVGIAGCNYDFDCRLKYLIMVVADYDHQNVNYSNEMLTGYYRKAIELFAKKGGGVIKFPLLCTGHLEVDPEISEDCAWYAAREADKTIGCNVRVEICQKFSNIISRDRAHEFEVRFGELEKMGIDYEEYDRYRGTIYEYTHIDIDYKIIKPRALNAFNTYFWATHDKIICSLNEENDEIQKYVREKIKQKIKLWANKNKLTLERAENDLSAYMGISPHTYDKIINKGTESFTRANAILMALAMKLGFAEKVELLTYASYVNDSRGRLYIYPLDSFEFLAEEYINKTIEDDKRIPGITEVNKYVKTGTGKSLYEWLKGCDIDISDIRGQSIIETPVTAEYGDEILNKRTTDPVPAAENAITQRRMLGSTEVRKDFVEHKKTKYYLSGKIDEWMRASDPPISFAELSRRLNGDVPPQTIGNIVRGDTSNPTGGVVLAIGIEMGLDEAEMNKFLLCSRDNSPYPTGEDEKRIYDFVEVFKIENGRPSPYKEVAGAIGIKISDLRRKAEEDKKKKKDRKKSKENEEESKFY
jgi:O-acetyl-ADP-ribose deacetylase (regulator of RNase III)/transcriptional regulator with XRE-family HTH domain